MKQSNLRSGKSFARRGLILATRVAGWIVLIVASAGLGRAAENTNIMVKPPPPGIPGGLGIFPVITSFTNTQNTATVQWFGLQGPFQLLYSSNANSNSWTPLGPLTFGSQVTVPLPAAAPPETAFFRVRAGRPATGFVTNGTMNYVGFAICADCHGDTVDEWSQTAHATNAFPTLVRQGQQDNPECLVCHTVGFGTPLGFKSEATTPHLANVQCESCHGPAANHIAVTRDPSVRPKVTMASEVCGGCHNFHHLTYSAWKSSPHGTTNSVVSTEMLQQGTPTMMTCGPCHSGAVREALLEGFELPSRIDAAFFPQTCGICHDAHAAMPNPPPDKPLNPQLREPVYSTDFYSYAPSTNLASFASQYNPDIQTCGQCHNMRGAQPSDTSRAPHHSPQYNMIIGQTQPQETPQIGPHGSEIDTQCVHCHSAPLSTTPPGPAEASSTNYFGHTFQVLFTACVECHITTNAAIRAVTNTQAEIKMEITNLVALLDTWSTSKAPADLRAKYGTNTWEYTTPGDLTNPGDNPTAKGPTTAEQAAIPAAIKLARFNLYLVDFDASFGVHNGPYARYLLAVARTNVNAELAKP